MSINLQSKVRRKIKFGFNIPFKVFKKPKNRNSVTSDLFPIRNDENISQYVRLPRMKYDMYRGNFLLGCHRVKIIKNSY